MKQTNIEIFDFRGNDIAKLKDFKTNLSYEEIKLHIADEQLNKELLDYLLNNYSDNFNPYLDWILVYNKNEVLSRLNIEIDKYLETGKISLFIDHIELDTLYKFSEKYYEKYNIKIKVVF